MYLFKITFQIDICIINILRNKAFSRFFGRASLWMTNGFLITLCFV